MTDNNRPGSGGAPQRSPAQRSMQAVRARIEGGFASAINSALSAAGLRVSVKSPPEVAPPRPPVAPLIPPVSARSEGGAPRPFPPAEFTSTPRPLPPGRVAVPESAAPSSPAGSAEAAAPPRPISPPKVFPKAPLLPIKPVRAAAAPKPPVLGPTPVQVMTAVQNAVVGAVSVVSGTLAGAAAARDAAVAVAKTASGAASVAGGVATVASGFFPQLASLGIGVPKAPKAPKNRPGMPPQRRVADIIANPMGKSPPPGSPSAGGAVPLPTKRVKRIPMIRAKSSLELSRKEKTRKRRSYEDLQMKPQIGLTPHEVLLKVATLALGKTLLGLLEAGARGQQKALQRASERMSQKQVMLLGMLPAQYIVQKLPPQPQITAEAPAPGSAEPVERPGVAKPGSPFKIRY